MRSMSYVSTAYLPRCFRMYDVRATYVRRIGPATYVLRMFKCAHKKKRCTSAYEEYELCIEEYRLCMLMYVRRTRDVPFVS